MAPGRRPARPKAKFCCRGLFYPTLLSFWSQGTPPCHQLVPQRYLLQLKSNWTVIFKSKWCKGVLGTLRILYKLFLCHIYPHSNIKIQLSNEKSKIQNPPLFQNSLKTPLEAKLKLKLEDGFLTDFFANFMNLQSIRSDNPWSLDNLSLK